MPELLRKLERASMQNAAAQALKSRYFMARSSLLQVLGLKSCLNQYLDLAAFDRCARLCGPAGSLSQEA